jgi:hypothetical protein
MQLEYAAHTSLIIERKTRQMSEVFFRGKRNLNQDQQKEGLKERKKITGEKRSSRGKFNTYGF